MLVDRCKEAGLRAIRLSAAGETSKKDIQEPFTLLRGVEDALVDTFGRAEGFSAIQAELGKFTAALEPADSLSQNRAIQATVARDCDALDQARHGLRRAILRIADRNPLFRLIGRHHMSS
jgi:hypothetical protein